jgi:hypothetical protein
MQHVLFVVVQTDDPGNWRNFLVNSDAKLKRHDKHVLRLSETVWLIDNQAAPSALAHLIVYAENYKVPFAIGALGDAPQWLPGGIDPKTILARSAQP